MKTLKDHVILYDAVCPMCNLYTKGFVDTGMLDKNGRLPYQEMPDKIACLVDPNRFTNEIALVHLPSGKVYYGVESLLQIIGNSFSWLRPCLRNRALFKMCTVLYKFVSFNRRVLVPAKKDEAGTSPMEPSFHKGYRIAFLVFTWLISSFLLSRYSLRLSAILPQTSGYREYLICSGQVAWQLAAVCLIRKERAWDYLGNMMTVSFAGSLLLGLIMIIGNWMALRNPGFYAAGFGMVVTAMLLEHMRRAALLGIGHRVTVSWIVYRLLVLLLIF